MKTLQGEYDNFLVKADMKRRSKTTMKSGIHEVSECSDSYDSEDSDDLRRRYMNHSFLDDEVDKARANLKFKKMAQYRALVEREP